MWVKYRLLFLIALLSVISKGHTQNCPGPGQNPVSAFPVCAAAPFIQIEVPQCLGSDVAGACGSGLSDRNPYWYSFRCYTAGTLGFLITPDIIVDDYDWQLFDVTGHNPNDVYTDGSLFVACNWSGFIGVTGASPAGTSLINCNGNSPNFSSMPLLIAGHDYLLMVSHFTPTQSGYQLSFTGGTAVIVDSAIPQIQSITPNCDGSQLTIRFNKKIKCSSLAANGSDFVMSNPAITVISATPFGCTGFDFDSALITFSGPLSPGNYTLNLTTGTDGNVLLDNCDRTPVIIVNPFSVLIPPIAMGTVTPPPCVPTSLTLTFAEPINCNSVAANGSDFAITGPSSVIISSATAVNCNASGETNTIILQLAGAINSGGNYDVRAVNGSDGNTLTGHCYAEVAMNAASSFTVVQEPPVAMGIVTQPPCIPNSVTLTFAEPVKCNSIAANGSDFIITGPSAVVVSSAAAVSCDANGETTSIIVQFTAPILISGTYNVQMATGTDGNTLMGINCDRRVNAGETAPFTLPQQPPVAMGVVTQPPCIPSSVTLTFAEPVKCNSIAANGSDFIISGPSAVTVSSAAAVSCDVNGETTAITIQFTAPIFVAGPYQVQMVTGSDGNTLMGSNCNRSINAGETAAFTLPQQPPVAMGNVTQPPCIPTSVTLTFAEPVKCNSIAANGSDFIIIGPSAVTVSSAAAVSCDANGETTAITIQFTAPIFVAGPYQVQMTTGSDGNTLMGSNCNRSVNAGETTAFTLPQQPPVLMGNVTQPPCIPTSVTLTFAEPVKCNSIAANGSDFIIIGPSAVTVSSAAAVNCDANGETTAITIQFTAPILVAGPYQVQMATGSDGNTLMGNNCNRSVNAGETAAFTLPQQPPIAMGNVTPPPCIPTSVTLTFAEPVKCNSIAANGSDFIITGPSVVTVSSATAVSCDANGETTSIIVQFTAPILISGNYNVQMATGTDGNTLMGRDCNRSVNAGETAAFTLPQQPPVAMGNVTPPPCIPSSVTLTFAEPVKCNSIAANGSDFIITGPSPVVVSSAAAVSCDANGETSAITIQFTAPIFVAGPYQVQMTTGSDGNTLMGSNCNRSVNAGETAVFTLPQQPPVAMGSVTPPPCTTSSLTLTFAEPVKCNSIAADGSDFIITGPTAVAITSAAGACNPNGETNTITIELSALITSSGNFRVQMAVGSDGNTLIGNCNRQTIAGDYVSFIIPDAFPVAMDSLVPLNCSPSSLKLIFSAPLRCSSVAADGSDFIITGPAPVSVASAAGTCNSNGLTTEVTIQLSSPLVVGGPYQLQLVAGNDGNTLLTDCDRQTPVGSSLFFSIKDTVSAEFQYQVEYDCLTDAITFSHNGQHNVNQWNWTINGTVESSSQTFTQIFSADSRNQVQLIVSNGFCSDTYSLPIILNNKVTVAFKVKDLICPLDTVQFINKSTGPVDNWVWSFGNGNTSGLQTPPVQIYPPTGAETFYPVSLTASNNYGCRVTATGTVKVLSNCLILVPTAFTPDNDGLNDYLYPLNAYKTEKSEFKVFNRWGQLVFQTKDITKKWDGRVNGVMQPTDVYIWTLEFTDKETRQKFSLKGTTTLIRK